MWASHTSRHSLQSKTEKKKKRKESMARKAHSFSSARSKVSRQVLLFCRRKGSLMEAWFWKVIRRCTARGSQVLKKIAVMVCPSCLANNHLASLLGDDRKPPDGKVHALDTLISFHICDYGLAQALQRTTFELPPHFELQAGGFDPQQHRERSWMTRSYWVISQTF